ncbi:hypothetical protein PXK60_21600 [Phaeobacter gallaeciensis]|nr:hypothetical protein [Phaeobacter gallaeciensis]
MFFPVVSWLLPTTNTRLHSSGKQFDRASACVQELPGEFFPSVSLAVLEQKEAGPSFQVNAPINLCANHRVRAARLGCACSDVTKTFWFRVPLVSMRKGTIHRRGGPENVGRCLFEAVSEKNNELYFFAFSMG